jgi:hypothetical protein
MTEKRCWLGETAAAADNGQQQQLTPDKKRKQEPTRGSPCCRTKETITEGASGREEPAAVAQDVIQSVFNVRTRPSAAAAAGSCCRTSSR